MGIFPRWRKRKQVFLRLCFIYLWLTIRCPCFRGRLIFRGSVNPSQLGVEDCTIPNLSSPNLLIFMFFPCSPNLLILSPPLPLSRPLRLPPQLDYLTSHNDHYSLLLFRSRLKRKKLSSEKCRTTLSVDQALWMTNQTLSLRGQ